MSKYPYIPYILPFFCGSAFVTIAILNSNAFQLAVFSMGLPIVEIDKFNAQRVWTIIILEVFHYLYFNVLNMGRYFYNFNSLFPESSSIIDAHLVHPRIRGQRDCHCLRVTSRQILELILGLFMASVQNPQTDSR